jgi:integrase
MSKVLEVKSGSFIVKIYQTKNLGFKQFSVSYYTPSGRKLKQFRDKKDALDFAKKTANELAQGKADAAGAFTFVDREELVAARKALQPHKMGVARAAEEMAAALAALKGRATVGQAVAAFLKMKGTTKAISLADAIKGYLDEAAHDVERKALSSSHHASQKVRLSQLARDVTCDLASLDGETLSLYASGKWKSDKTRRNFLGDVGAVIKWAKANNYLSREEVSASTIAGEMLGRRPKGGQSASPIWTVTEAETVFKAFRNDDDLLIVTVIQALTGARTDMIIRADWKHIKWTDNRIHFPRENSKVRRPYYAPMLPALAAFLKSKAKTAGRIVSLRDSKHYSNRMAPILETNKIAWKKNAFRTTLISSRAATGEPLEKIASECNTSVKKIQDEYLELLDQTSAKEWLAMDPLAILSI